MNRSAEKEIPQFHPARFWEKLENGFVRCRLCPRHCTLGEGKRSYCSVRYNQGGSLVTRSYGYPVALHVDPVEKKPLYHFLPGTKTFSLGTFGCTLGCRFCQNDTLSAQTYDKNTSYAYFPPEKIITLALQYRCESVAFTYNEPAVFAEYLLDVADLAHEKGLKTVMVTNGFLAEESAKEIFARIDAANIDMKGFSEEFYSSMCAGRLEDVLRNIKLFHSLEGKHLELTNLIIPGKNDSDAMIHAYLDFVEQNLSVNVPLHFSAYFPAFLYRASPPTDPETIRRIVQAARARGFKNVHAGNI